MTKLESRMDVTNPADDVSTFAGKKSSKNTDIERLIRSKPPEVPASKLRKPYRSQRRKVKHVEANYSDLMSMVT